MNRHPIRISTTLISAVVSLLISGCIASSESQFQLEENNKNTIFSKMPLAVGSKITFVAEAINNHETLSLNKCGEPCNTAVHVRSFNKRDFDKSNIQTFTIERSGVYYFWVSSDIEKGKCTSIPVSSLKYQKNHSVVQYSSGTVIKFSIELPGRKQ